MWQDYWKNIKQDEGAQTVGEALDERDVESVPIQNNETKWTINSAVNCNSYNIIYLIECNNPTCKARYIWQSFCPLKKRFSEHINNIFWTQATGQHFNLPGHIDNITITINLEKIMKVTERKEKPHS